MINLQEKQIWFFTGSQHLYGEEVLRTVAENSRVSRVSARQNRFRWISRSSRS